MLRTKKFLIDQILPDYFFNMCDFKIVEIGKNYVAKLFVVPTVSIKVVEFDVYQIDSFRHKYNNTPTILRCFVVCIYQLLLLWKLNKGSALELKS